MASRMRTETMLFENLHLFVVMLFLLAYIKLVTSEGAGDNGTVKLIRCRDNERRALLDFKEGLVDEYGSLSSWGKSQEEDCCKWRGIHCSNSTSHVNVLDISSGYGSGWAPLRGKVSPSLLELNHLNYLDLSWNQLSGELPDCWMNVDQLLFLNLANNNLSGKIPTSIGLLNGLQILQLRKNNFSGELPSSLKNCRDLRLLDLSENELWGKVPTWIGTHLTSLIVFSLRKNEFFGSVPLHICHLRYAQVLDLSQNNLSGSIPLCVNNLTSLVQRNSSSADGLPIIALSGGSNVSYEKYVADALVQWKGRESEYRKTLGFLKLIDLSSNKMVGKIPQEFASLEGLISLNLSSNNLTGNIIQNIGQMKMLEILDLSSNQLSGEIPTGLASLTFLSVLDLSSNKFTGKIPSSTQLQSFNASVYAGNDKLCGLPLPRTCQDDKPPLVGHGKDDNNEEGDDRFVKNCFYVSVILGFVTGFWGFLGPILLRSTWRHAYFRLLGKIKDWIYMTTSVNMARLKRKI